MQLGLALQIGFLRMTGCVMNSTDIIPRRVIEFLGSQLEIKTLRVTSLRALYARKPTLHEHQRLAPSTLTKTDPLVLTKTDPPACSEIDPPLARANTWCE